MIEAETVLAVEQTVIAEEPAAEVADYDISALARARPFGSIEGLGKAEVQRAAAGNGDRAGGDFIAVAVMQQQPGIARRVPGRRSRLDQMAQRLQRRWAETQE